MSRSIYILGRWLGLSDIVVTRYDGVKYDPDPEYEQIHCKAPMLFLWKLIQNPEDVYKVRVLTERPPYSFSIDYAIPTNAKECFLRGQYNHTTSYSTIDKVVNYEYRILFDQNDHADYTLEPTSTEWLNDVHFSIESSKLIASDQNPKSEKYKLIRFKIRTLYPTDWWNPYPELKLKCNSKLFISTNQ